MIHQRFLLRGRSVPSDVLSVDAFTRRNSPSGNVAQRHVDEANGQSSQYVAVPVQEVGIRIQLTSANTDAQVDHLIDVLTALAERFRTAGQDPAVARDAVSRGLAQLVAP